MVDSVYTCLQNIVRFFLEKCGVRYNEGYTFLNRSDNPALSMKVYYFGHAQTEKDVTVFEVMIGCKTLKETIVPHTDFLNTAGEFDESLFYKAMFNSLRCGKELEDLMINQLSYEMARTKRTMEAQRIDACKALAQQFVNGKGEEKQRPSKERLVKI